MKFATMVSCFYHLAIFLIIIAAAADAVDFTETQDVEKLDKVTYPQFLQRLRDKLGGLPGATNIGGVPVLPPQDESNPKRWFDLKLKGKDGKETSVRIRGDNLYVIGYQMQNSEQWLELGKKGDKQYISGSNFLGFRGSYEALVTQAGVKSLFKVSLAKSTLSKAAATLAESTKNNERAGALIVVAQMVSEACRLDDISTYFTTNFDKSENFLQDWMLKDLEQNWGDFSNIVRWAKNCPKYKYKTQTINGQQIKTADDLRKRLRVILRTKKSEECPKSYLQALFLDDEAVITGSITGSFWPFSSLILCLVVPMMVLMLCRAR